MQSVISKLQNEFDLILLIINNIERYSSCVQKAMVDSVNKGITPENIPKTCFEDGVTHSEQLEKHLEFIEFLIQWSYGEVQLGNANIDKLWKLFVTHSAFEFDRNLFFKWLTKEKFASTMSQGKEYRRVFSTEEREYLFSSIFCNADVVDAKSISYNCFKCFEKYFGFYNREKEFVHYFKGHYTIYHFESLEGLKTLWEIVIKSEDEKVKEESSTLLCTLHFNLYENSYDMDKRFNIWKIFIAQWLHYLNIKKERKIINSAIMLLIKFFDVYDGRGINLSNVNSSTSFPVHIYCQDDGSK